jgi:hypothetical protein
MSRGVYGPLSNRQKVSLLCSSNSVHSLLLTCPFQTGDKLRIDDLRARKSQIRKANESTKLPANRSTSNQVSRNRLSDTPINPNKEVVDVKALLDRSRQYVTPNAKTPIDVDLLHTTPFIHYGMLPPPHRLYDLPVASPLNPTPPFEKRVRKCVSKDLYSKGRTITPDTKAETIKVPKKVIKKDPIFFKALADIADDELESVQDSQEALAYLRMINSPVSSALKNHLGNKMHLGKGE